MNVAIFESGQSSAYTTADFLDIPAGAAGAIVYGAVRLVMPGKAKRTEADID